jgi:hypothetical protein
VITSNHVLIILSSVCSLTNCKTDSTSQETLTMSNEKFMGTFTVLFYADKKLELLIQLAPIVSSRFRNLNAGSCSWVVLPLYAVG